jgi:gamma-glutamylcyclotransferase (GGCT)/AIG2-like uncharacterized protein YtfP
MKISDKIKTKLYKWPKNKTISFKELHLQLDCDVNINSYRKALYSLHKQGLITINSRGKFIKENPFKVYLFVYGSLKKGFPNNDILSQAKYISKAKTISKFAMYKEINENYPYIIRDSYCGQNIEGEVYQITRKDLLEKIDAFEGAPDYFKRIDIMIKTRNKKIKAKTYVLSAPKVPINKEQLSSWNNNTILLDIDFDAYYKSILC